MKLGVLIILLFVPVYAAGEPELLNALSRLGNVTPSELLSVYGNLTNYTQLSITKPFVVVKGNRTDFIEQSVAAPFMEGAQPYTDSEVSYLTEIAQWPFNIILIGGPLHNSITHYLWERGVLPFIERDSNRPKTILQFITFRDSLILLVSSSYSYTPEPGVEPVEGKAASAAAAVATVVAVNAASVVVTQAAFPGAQLIADLLEFLKGGAQTYAEDLVEEEDQKKLTGGLLDASK